MRFDDRVVVVPGAGNGIGKAHAAAFSRRGAAVLVNDIDRIAADKLAAKINAEGGRAAAEYSSVVDGGDDIIGHALEEFGNIDVLINNAGIGVIPIEGGLPISEMICLKVRRYRITYLIRLEHSLSQRERLFFSTVLEAFMQGAIRKMGKDWRYKWRFVEKDLM